MIEKKIIVFMLFLSCFFIYGCMLMPMDNQVILDPTEKSYVSDDDLSDGFDAMLIDDVDNLDDDLLVENLENIHENDENEYTDDDTIVEFQILE